MTSRRQTGAGWQTDAPLAGEGGQVDATVLAVEDHSEGEQARTDLIRSHQLLETILEHTPVLVAYLDSDLNFVRVNRAYAEADQREPSFYPGKNHFDLYPNAENQRIFERVVETGAPYFAYAKPFEYAEHPERGVSYWDWSLVPIKDSQASVTGLVLSLMNVTERVQARQALEQSEERFRQLAAHVESAFWIGTPGDGERGQVLYVNPAFERIFGISRDEIVRSDRAWLECLHPEDREQTLACLEASLRDGSMYDVEYRIVRADGAVRWIWARGFPVRNEQGEVYRTVGIAQDITERKAVERELREGLQRERFLGDIIRNASVAVGVGYPDGRLGMVNQAAEELTGYSQEELAAIDWNLVLTPPEWRDHETAKLAELHRTRRAVRYEKEYVRKDGSRVPIELVVHPHFDEDGEIECYVAFLTDTSGRKQAEEVLQKRTHDLGKRVKELHCLYEISRLVEASGATLEEILQGTVDLIPSAWQHPEVTCAQIIFGDRRFRTAGFRETGWRQVEDLVVGGKQAGRVEVYLLEKRPAADEGPFLEEERALLQATAQRLGKIVERIQAQAALREREREYRLLLENLQEGVWAIDAEGYTSYVNPRMAEMLGYTVEEMRGKHLFDFMDERGVEIAQHKLKQRQEGIREQHDFEFLRKDGERIHVVLEASPMTDEEGNYVGALAGVLDITQRVRAEEALRQAHVELERRVAERTAELSAANLRLRQEIDERRQVEEALRNSRELLDRTFASLRDAVLIVDADSLEIMDCNPSAEEVLGYSPAELQGRTMHCLHVDEVALSEFQAHLQRTKEESGFLYLPEFPMARKDGTVFPTEQTMTPLRDDEGKQIGWVSVMRDLSERKLAEEAMQQYQVRLEALRELDRLRSELIANVSHEIRTPLGLIEVFASSLLMDDVELDSETERKFLLGIVDEADRLDALVANLLSLSRIEDGRFYVHRRQTDVAQLAREVVGAMRAQATAQHCLVLDVPPTPQVAMIDARQVEQVLRNLLSNAIRYSPDGGTIAVRARCEKEQVVLSVSDQGIGVPVEEQAKIFDRFYRVEGALSGTVHGIGLGLAVCRGIVEAHGGRIWVESAVGEGSTFHVRMPRAPRDPGLEDKV